MKKLLMMFASLSLTGAIIANSSINATAMPVVSTGTHAVVPIIFRQQPTVEVKATAHPVVPVWLKGYKAGVRYYYFPDLEVYYDVNTGNYVYWSGTDWVYATALPGVYGGIDLAGANYVALTYTGLHPEHYIVTHIKTYPVAHRVTVTGVRYYDVDKKVTVEKHEKKEASNPK